MHTQSLARVAVAGLLFTALNASARTTAPTTLGIGDPAPAISVTSWAKGTPVAAFEPGHVYVVEFWATWCGPCKKSIPHLTELAKKYAGKVSVVGVSVWEQPEQPTDAAINDIVLPFVKSMGDKMDYHVAIDGTAAFMTKHWLAAAGQKGIPASFVVNGEGKIAWIGLPTGLDAVLASVTAGTWDVAVAKQKAIDAAAALANAPEQKVIDAIMAARAAHDDAAVLAALDKADALPKLAGDPDLISVRLESLLRTDAAAAVAYVKKLTSPGGLIAAKPDFAWSVTRVVPGNPTTLLTAADWKAIATAVDPMVSPGTSPSGPTYLAYAELQLRAGDRDSAVFYQRKGVNLIAAWNQANANGLSKANVDYLAKAQARLDAMIAGKN